MNYSVTNMLLAAVLPLGMAGSLLGADAVHAQDRRAGIQRVLLDGKAGGKRFDGIGVVDGGGATSVLLKDYPEPQRSQILDLVYKPKFGASISALLVEVPGDGNSTQGSMPSHQHTRDDLNYRRGYTWWVLAEAKKRNPELTLDGTAWSGPGWLGDNGRLFPNNHEYGDARFFSQDTVDYYLSWLKGARDVYGLNFDAFGVRNEKGVSYGFAEALRKGMNDNGFAGTKLHAFDNWPPAWALSFVKDMQTDKALRDSLDIVSAHANATPEVRKMIEAMGKPFWVTEQHVYELGYDGLIDTVKMFNETFIESGATKIIQWYGIGGLYSLEPYSGEKEALVRANSPWSGNFRINQKLWGFAHYGQFSEAGWIYLNGGSGMLAGGGSYVTLKSPGDDYSVIIETKGAKLPQSLHLDVFNLSGKPLAVWRSTETEQFVRQADVTPHGGSDTITLEPDAVYSLTTTRGQQKGGYAAVPAVKAFPFPYRETFDGYGDSARWGNLPRYTADIYGAFELAACPARKGMCMHQASPVRPISWGPDWEAYTIIGDDQWRDYDVSADVYLKPSDVGGVMGRVNEVGTGYGFIPRGYFLRMAANGDVNLTVARGKVDKKALVGDAEQQALIKTTTDVTEGGEKVLATAKAPGITANSWHTMKLRFQGETITGFVDGKQVVSVKNDLCGKGMTGLLSNRDGQKMSTPFFDDLIINKVGAALPVPNKPMATQMPMYPGIRR